MKKLLLLLIVLLVPYQATWAAASAYCEHEHGAAAHHFGHHTHQHHAGNAGSSSTDSSGTLHGDCGYCHLGGACAVTVGVDLAPTPSSVSVAISPPDSSPPSALLERPERPKWAQPA